MNTLDNLTINGNLTVSSVNTGYVTATNCGTTSLSSSYKITFGSHTFDADQLGQLLTYLLSQHPELSV